MTSREQFEKWLRAQPHVLNLGRHLPDGEYVLPEDEAAWQAWEAARAVLPDNLRSHRDSWIAAMERLVELEPESFAPDEDEKGFWKHELQALRDMYADLDRLDGAQ